MVSRRTVAIENSRIHDINRTAYASVAIYGNVNKFNEGLPDDPTTDCVRDKRHEHDTYFGQYCGSESGI
jgi:hypothetical protein